MIRDGSFEFIYECIAVYMNLIPASFIFFFKSLKKYQNSETDIANLTPELDWEGVQ